jgi:hypothetical protein
MTQRLPCSNSNNQHIDKKNIDREQLDRIIEAILAGKYSWACFLLLRCIDYDPLHYIPYRTYNRLVKENCQVSRSTQVEARLAHTHQRSIPIQDLEYLETAKRQNSCVRGGTALNPPELNFDKCNSILQQLQNFFTPNR